MAVEVVMPKLGWNMEQGHVVEWLKHDGDVVQTGEAIFTVETDKALTDVEALESGVLRIPADTPGIGEDVPIGAVLAYVVRPDEAASFEQAAISAAMGGDVGGSSAQALEHDATVMSGELVTSVGNVPGGQVPVSTAPAASPRACRVAAELGVEWSKVRGSGRTGRIVERDVRAAAETAQRSADSEKTPVTPVRRLIGQRMVDSARTVAAVTLTTDADATELVRLRTQMKTALAKTGGTVPAYHDLLTRLTALALLEHPELNASLDGDQIVRHPSVHMGIAVETERALLVPVIREVPGKSVQQIAVESARLIEQARAGAVAADDLRGSTFTISNLGMYGIDAFTPIINLPECAILGMGRIASRPVVVDEATEAVAVRKMMALSLTFDHRVVDGATAARFLQRVVEFVVQPVLWMIR